MEPVSRESDSRGGVHHHVHQWAIIVLIVCGVALLLGLFVLEQRGITETIFPNSRESSSKWSYEEKLDVLSDLNARAEAERRSGIVEVGIE